jgi:uncharacterized protein YejL (UPF0352 family)
MYHIYEDYQVINNDIKISFKLKLLFKGNMVTYIVKSAVANAEIPDEDFK